MPTTFSTTATLLLAALALWRLAFLLVHEAGPGGVLLRLRAGRLQGLLGCMGCISLWLALPMAAWLGQGAAQVGVLALALSGAAMLLQRATTHEPALPLWQELPPPEENTDALLRQPTPQR